MCMASELTRDGGFEAAGGYKHEPIASTTRPSNLAITLAGARSKHGAHTRARSCLKRLSAQKGREALARKQTARVRVRVSGEGEW